MFEGIPEGEKRLTDKMFKITYLKQEPQGSFTTLVPGLAPVEWAGKAVLLNSAPKKQKESSRNIF